MSQLTRSNASRDATRTRDRVQQRGTPSVCFAGLSVSVDVFTLVCISVERYIAICRPLLILKLQSLRFANFFNGLILFLIWTLGLLTALPQILMHNLCSLPQPGRFKCEKLPPKYFDERYYMIALDGEAPHSRTSHGSSSSFSFSFLFSRTDAHHARALHSNHL